MVKKTNKNGTREIDKLNKTSTADEDISRHLSSRISKSKDNPLNDDLIVSLSDAYENKRARQVVEWEKLGKQKAQPTI